MAKVKSSNAVFRWVFAQSQTWHWGSVAVEWLVQLPQAALDSPSGLTSNVLHVVLTCTHVILHLGDILHQESYSEDQVKLQVELLHLEKVFKIMESNHHLTLSHLVLIRVP